MTDDTGYTMTQAGRLTGINPSTLQSWVHSGLVKPLTDFGRGRNNGKRWYFADLVGLRVIASLRKQNIPMQRVRKLLITLRKFAKQKGSLAALAASNLVVLPNNDVAIIDDDQNPVSLIQAPGQTLIQPVMIVGVAEVVSEIEGRMAADKDPHIVERVRELKEQGAWLIAA